MAQKKIKTCGVRPQHRTQKFVEVRVRELLWSYECCRRWLPWLAGFLYSGNFFIAKTEILWMLLEIIQHNLMKTVCFSGFLHKRWHEIQLLVKEQSYGPSKLTATSEQNPTSGTFDCDPLPAAWNSTNVNQSWKTNRIHEITLSDFQNRLKQFQFSPWKHFCCQDKSTQSANQLQEWRMVRCLQFR